VCQRCGSFVCSGCIEIRNEDVFCAACAALLDRPASKRSRVLAVFSGLWLIGLGAAVLYGVSSFRHSGFAGMALMATPFATGTLAAVWLVEWRAQRRGESASKGKVPLQISGVFIGIEVLISLITVAAVIYIITHKVSA
jgi:hypothetical protein